MALTSTANLLLDSFDIRVLPSDSLGAPLGTSGAGVALLERHRGKDDWLNAIASRRAARLNAASIDDCEVDRLFAERKQLLQKKFEDGLSVFEQRKLNLIRWNLDRIQDARYGEALDNLESAVSLYENIGKEIEHLTSELRRYAPKGTRR